MNVMLSNKPENVDFDLTGINLKSNYNIILHYVYDPFNHYETEFAFLNTLDDTNLVILWHPVEMGVWDQSWISKLNNIVTNKKLNLVYLTGCSNELDLANHFDIKFKYQYLPVFDVRAIDLWRTPAEVNVNKNNKFTCLNAKDTAHRRFTFSTLYSNNLLSDGICSYRCTNWDSNSNPNCLVFTEGQGFSANQLSDINIASNFVRNIIPMQFDGSDVLSKLDRNVFLDSYVNIVNETDFVNVPHGYNRRFVTEKTFSSIANNQMFIVVGHAHSLKLLRDLGYKTFSNVINEDYDTIEHNGDRLIAVNQEIVRFLSRPIEQIQHDYIKIQDIIKYNRDLLFSQNLNSRLQSVVSQHT